MAAAITNITGKERPPTKLIPAPIPAIGATKSQIGSFFITENF